MKRRNVTLMVVLVGKFFCIFVRVALPRGAMKLWGCPPITYRLVRTMVRTCDESSRYATTYIPDPSLKRQTLTSKQGLLSPLLENLPSTQIS